VNQFELETRKESDFEVLLLPGIENDANFAKFLHYLQDLGVHVNWIPLNSGNFGYWLIPAPQEGSPFLTFSTSDINFFQKLLKRVFDIAFSAIFLLLFSPLYIVIAAAILLSDGWPILFIQSRVGQNGKNFGFLKFRTMIKDAETKVSEVANMHSNDHILFKNANDPRITKVGRKLRRYSLDELPQFLNVLTGSMSVVGPRPALPREVSAYDSMYERRLIAKPGITGPWQIGGRSDLDLQTSVSLDLNYLNNWSFTRDLWIIVSTVGAVLKGKGAY
jgi:exopolysaccharide biosynthesis polyprenyl glycosylphosphotransferase